MHLFFFGLDWSWTEDFGLSVQLREGSIPIVAVIFFVIIGLFLIFWFLPLELWNFGTNALDQKDIEGGSKLSKSSTEALIHVRSKRMENQKMNVDGNQITEGVTAIMTCEEEEMKVGQDLQDLSFERALTLHQDDDLLSHLIYVDVRKYLPDPTRREFGVLKIN